MRSKSRVSLKVIYKLLVGFLAALSLFSGSASAQNPVPLINQPLVPQAIAPSSAGFTLTVNGTGFASGAVVKWNGSGRTTTFVSGSRLTASILASDIATARTASVTVVNPATGGGTSNVVLFQVTTANSAFGLAQAGYATADRSYALAVGDFNGDGKPDLAVANYAPGTISVLLGNGNGTFQPHVDYATGTYPHSVAVGDFNKDGKLDLVVANNGSNTVSILLGNGDGTFQPQVEYATGNSPRGVAVADFNRDGKLDLVVANYDNINVLLGNGDGTFQPAVNYAAGAHPGSAAVGDFNRDGKLDLVVANNSTNTINVLLGNGDGTFQPAVSYSTGPSPTEIAVADFNADDKLDLAVGAGTGVSVLLGNGDGTFQTHVDYGTGSGNPCSVAVGDFNGDGRSDLVVADLFSTDVHLLLGNGNGTFGAASTDPAGRGPSSVAVGDFNGDGRLDVAVADSGSATVSVLLQAPPPVSLSPTSLNFPDQVVGTSSAPQSVTLTNADPLTLTISSIAVTGTNATDFSQTNTCDSGLPPGGQCTITVTFAPTQTGPRTRSVTITNNSTGSPQAIALSGTGVVSGPNATLPPTSLTFATLLGTSSAAQSVTLSNYGTVTLGITSVGFTGADPGDFAETNTCGSSVAPGASCTISITFKPTQSGSRTAMLSITDNAPGSPQNVSLTGTTGTVVELNPATLNFGVVQVGFSKSLSTMLTNGGSTTLNFSGITTTGTDAGELSQTNTCGSSVGAGKSCTITVTFRPTEAGSDSAQVSISDNGGGSPQQVPLSGSGCVITNGRCKTAPLSSLAVRSAIAAPSMVAVPSPTGPSKVGTRVVDWVDSTRDDPFLAEGIKRELLVRFWYPTPAGQDCKLADYTSPKVWARFSQLLAVPLPDVKTNSCRDAPMTDGLHPVVVFTHGYTGTFTDYTFLYEDLASRGYVVASVDHTYEATAVEFPDGRLATSVLGSHLANNWRVDDETLQFMVSVRLDDLRFVLNQLQRINNEASGPFDGKLDMSRVALAGHSLGGLTTLLGVGADSRFRAGILLDPYMSEDVSNPTLTPVLLLAAGRTEWSENELSLWNDLQGPRFAVNFRGAEHVMPSDAVWLAKGAIQTGDMGPDKTIAAIRNYIAAFLDTNLRGKPFDPLLTGPSSDYPDVEVTTQKQPLYRRP